MQKLDDQSTTASAHFVYRSDKPGSTILGWPERARRQGASCCLGNRSHVEWGRCLPGLPVGTQRLPNTSEHAAATRAIPRGSETVPWGIAWAFVGFPTAWNQRRRSRVRRRRLYVGNRLVVASEQGVDWGCCIVG